MGFPSENLPPPPSQARKRGKGGDVRGAGRDRLRESKRLRLDSWKSFWTSLIRVFVSDIEVMDFGIGTLLFDLHRWAVAAGFELRYRNSLLVRNLQELQASQWLPEEEVRAIQWGKLKALIRHSYHNVPYYKRVMDSLGMLPEDIRTSEDYAKLPILSKAEVNAHRDEMVDYRYPRNKLIKTASGGSTGVPVTLYHDPEMIASYRAVKLRNFEWVGWRPGNNWVRLWGSAFDVAPHQKLFQKAADRLSNMLVLPCFEMSRASMAMFAGKLQRFQPDIIEAYVTPLYVFAGYLVDHGIDNIRPKGIICSAEMLYPYQRAVIETAFACKVFNRYGGREMGDIAHECEAGTMHINAETTYVEFIKDGLPASEGESGEMILTGLSMYGMPMLRYQVEDIGRTKILRCSCGRGLPTMDMVEGRVQDMISLPSGRFLPGEFFPHLFKDYPVERFQVIQESMEQLEIKLIPAAGLTEEHISGLKKIIKEYAGEEIEIEFSLVEEIPFTPSGKFRYTISRVPVRLS